MIEPAVGRICRQLFDQKIVASLEIVIRERREEVVQGVDLHVEYRFKLRMIDLWQIVVLTHQKPGAEPSAQPVIPETQIVGTRRWAIDAQ